MRKVRVRARELLLEGEVIAGLAQEAMIRLVAGFTWLWGCDGI